MPQGLMKPPDLDDNGRPIPPPDIDDSGSPIPNESGGGGLESIYSGLMNAPKFITDPARRFAESVSGGSTSPVQGGFFDALKGIPNVASKLLPFPGVEYDPMPTLRGFMGGAVEGAASQMSPANILTLGRGKLPTMAAKLMGGMQVAHGASEVMGGNTAEGLGDIGFGALMGGPAFLGSKPGISAIGDNVAGRIPDVPILDSPPTTPDVMPNYFDVPPTTPPPPPPMGGGLGAVAQGVRTKPKMKLNSDGTYTDLNTGEITPISPTQSLFTPEAPPIPQTPEIPQVPKTPKVILNEDGTYTDTTTGEVLSDTPTQVPPLKQGAKYAFEQPGDALSGVEPFHMYHIPTDKGMSTVSGPEATKRGFELPPIGTAMRRPDSLPAFTDESMGPTDISGRSLGGTDVPAPIQERPAGPWDSNIDNTPPKRPSLKDRMSDETGAIGPGADDLIKKNRRLSEGPKGEPGRTLLRNLQYSLKGLFTGTPETLDDAMSMISKDTTGIIKDKIMPQQVSESARVLREKADWGLQKLPVGVAGQREELEIASNMLKSMADDLEVAAKVDPIKAVYTFRERLAKLLKDETGAVGPGTPEAIKRNLENRVNNAPLGTKVVIKSSLSTPASVKQVLEAGYTFKGLDDKGGFMFEKTTGPTTQPMLETEVGQERVKLGPDINKGKATAFEEALNFPRTVMASMDFSAPLRQGLGLIHYGNFWKALPGMFKAFGSEETFQQIQKSISDKALFKKRIGKDGKILPSFAEDAGVKLTDLTDITSREESMLSGMAEKYIPGIRRSNRAYVAFLNKLRADTFEQLIVDAKVFGVDGKADARVARNLAEFINTATGRGSLKGSVGLGSKFSASYNLEPSARALASVLFSPRLMASRLNMLNPQYYIMMDPYTRQRALRSLFAIGAAGSTFTQLGRLAGGTVESDPASSDFGKLKLGNTRIDPYGGFQQYIVAGQRLAPQLDLSALGIGKIGGEMKSTLTGRSYDLANPQFGQSDKSDVAIRFLRGKTNPIINFGWGLLAGSKEISGQKMNMTTPNPFENSIAQRFVPMIVQDINEMVKDEVSTPATKIAAGTLATFGMGSQTYGPNR